MKICSKCGSSNGDGARFCDDCGAAFVPQPGVPQPGAAESVTREEPLEKSEVAKRTSNLAARAELLQSRRRVDIMFVLDCTGSMQGEIDAIRDAILGFAATIRSDGVRARIGLVEFRDRLFGEEHRVLTFDGAPFTDDPEAFRAEVMKLKAYGGQDEPESSLDAIMLALGQPFDPEANKVLVLVTDAPPHIPDLETGTIEQVLEAIRNAGIKQIYLVIRALDERSQIYLRLLEAARGLAFDLGQGDDFRNRAEHFKRTLMSLGKTISQGTR